MQATGTFFPPIDDITIENVLASVKRLIPLIEEEVDELEDSTDISDVLDAVVDIGVYYSQLVLLMEHIGVNYTEACQAVCHNNDLKYTHSMPLVMDWYSNLKDKSARIEDNEVDGVKYFCLKNQNGKVVKYKGFPRVDLTDYIPEEWL